MALYSPDLTDFLTLSLKSSFCCLTTLAYDLIKPFVSASSPRFELVLKCARYKLRSVWWLEDGCGGGGNEVVDEDDDEDEDEMQSVSSW